ncbi:MAG: hypothetical protein D6739_11090, partial [Nitrospirae bacterium]
MSRGGRRLAVSLGAGGGPLRARPGEEVTLPLAVRDAEGRGVEAEVAVAVVDERVLALTGYATPDLADLGRFRLPDRVATRELRRLLVGQTPLGHLLNRLLTGGGGAAKAAPAAGPGISARIRRDFRPVAFFDPAVVTGRDGRAEVRFTLPDTMTTYRCFAVACDRGSGFASAERPLVAVKPFYLEPGLPRFLHAGDRFRFPLTAFDEGEAGGRAALEVEAAGPVRLALAASEVAVAGGGSAAAEVSGEATGVGEATARFRGRLGGEADAVERRLPVRPPHTLAREGHTGEVEGRGRRTVPLAPAARSLPWKRVIPGEARARLYLSRSPLLHLRPAAAYLLDYPYGCIEQTSSATFALAALRKAVAAGAIPGISLAEVDRFLRAGVERIRSMQVAGGGFAYWPGETKADREGSLYAIQALVAASEAGVEVDAKSYARALLGYALRVVAEGGDGAPFATYLLGRAGFLRPERIQEVASSQGGRAALLLPLAVEAARDGLHGGGLEARLFDLLALAEAGEG